MTARPGRVRSSGRPRPGGDGSSTRRPAQDQVPLPSTEQSTWSMQDERGRLDSAPRRLDTVRYLRTRDRGVGQRRSWRPNNVCANRTSPQDLRSAAATRAAPMPRHRTPDPAAWGHARASTRPSGLYGRFAWAEDRAHAAASVPGRLRELPVSSRPAPRMSCPDAHSQSKGRIGCDPGLSAARGGIADVIGALPFDRNSRTPHAVMW